MLKGSLTDEEHSQIKMASDTLEAYKDGFLIYDNVYTVEEIRLKCKKQKIQKGLDVVAVDFIQNLRGAENIYERMSNAAIGLQQIAQELSITMIIASQVTQGGAGWVNKEAIEYKGAGEIAAIADVAIWLQRVKEDRSARAIILRKVRHGVPGKMTVRISFPSGKIIDMLEGEEGEDVAREQLAQGGV
jgi:replicative DNA helicase